MSKAATRFHSFSEFRAQYSERFKSNGDFRGFKNGCDLGPTLIEQIKTVGARIEELKAKPSLDEEERREMNNHIREYGNWKKVLTDASTPEFEKLFITVAAARLPREHFMVILNEARVLWRQEGWAEFKPVDWKKVRKLQRRIKEASKE